MLVRPRRNSFNKGEVKGNSSPETKLKRVLSTDKINQGVQETKSAQRKAYDTDLKAYENSLFEKEKNYREEAKNIINDMYKKVLDNKGQHSDESLIKDTKNLYAFEYQKDNIKYTILASSPESGEQALRKLGLKIKDGDLSNLKAGEEGKEGVKRLKFDEELVNRLKNVDSIRFLHADGSTSDWKKNERGEMSKIAETKREPDRKHRKSLLDLLDSEEAKQLNETEQPNETELSKSNKQKDSTWKTIGEAAETAWNGTKLILAPFAGL